VRLWNLLICALPLLVRDRLDVVARALSLLPPATERLGELLAELTVGVGRADSARCESICRILVRAAGLPRHRHACTADTGCRALAESCELHQAVVVGVQVLRRETAREVRERCKLSARI